MKREKAKNPFVAKLTIKSEQSLRALSDKLGLTRVSVVELALRKLAESESITEDDLAKYPDA